MIKVFAVVVTYNRKQLLEECIKSLENQSRHVDNIVIINNNSSDGTTEFLSALNRKELLVFNLDENIGGAAGFSLGVKKAYNSGADYIWIMDDDTIPDTGALEALLEKKDVLENKFGFLCSNVRWKDGSATNIPKVSSRWSSKSMNNLIQVDTATFVSVFVSRSVVKKVGIPTAKLFIWGDDTEYTTRISVNYPSYFVIDSTVLHKSQNNLTTTNIINDDNIDRISRYFYMYRNLVYIARKYNGGKAVLKTLLSANIFAFKALFLSKDHKFKRFYTVFKGLLYGLFFSPKVEFPR